MRGGIVRLVVGLVVGGVVGGGLGGLPVGEAQRAQLRVLRAKTPTGAWYQRMDSGAKDEATFQAEVAAQFGVPASEVTVVVTPWTEAQRSQAVRELGTGMHDGAAVVPAPTFQSERPDAFRQALGSIFTGTPAQKQARWGEVLEKYPAAAAWLTLLRGPGPLSADAKALLTEITTRLKSKIGTPGTEVLTQAEYDALKTLATASGLGALVP